MTELITIARPYARAAFESASAAGALPEWSDFLARAAALVGEPQLQTLIGNPRVQPDELVQFVLELAIEASAEKGDSGTSDAHRLESQHNFLRLLAHYQRLALLPEIAAQYEQLRAEAEHIVDVAVLVARELTAEQADKLRSALERRLRRTVRLHPRLDASLLGGAVVQYGDYVVDGSLRRRVERLASELSGA